jgi:hypothetical protein
MPPPNDGHFDWGGDLSRLRRGVQVGQTVEARGMFCELSAGPLGKPFEWCDPDWLEDLLTRDPALQGAVLFALRKGGTSWQKRVAAAVQAVCEQYLAVVRAKFQEELPTLTDYVLAKAAYEKLHPPEQWQPDPPPLPGPQAPPVPAADPPATGKRHRKRRPARTDA